MTVEKLCAKQIDRRLLNADRLFVAPSVVMGLSGLRLNLLQVDRTVLAILSLVEDSMGITSSRMDLKELR